ncbi:MAG: hypothetical protein R2849_13475 [Thermomicrobiales bacterium]
MLGTGGAESLRGMIRAQHQLELGRKLTIVKLDELPDDALVVPMGGMSPRRSDWRRSDGVTRER